MGYSKWKLNDNDEINLVTPGFNSWTTVMGFAPTGFEPNQQLVSFDGKGKYHDHNLYGDKL